MQWIPHANTESGMYSTLPWILDLGILLVSLYFEATVIRVLKSYEKNNIKTSTEHSVRFFLPVIIGSPKIIHLNIKLNNF